MVGEAADELEPDLGMRSFIVCGFLEDRRDFFRSVFLRLESEELVFYVRLGFSGKRSIQILFGLGAFQSGHFSLCSFLTHFVLLYEKLIFR